MSQVNQPKSKTRWTRTERDAVARLRLLAVEDPDPELRLLAPDALTGAQLGLEGPLPPVIEGDEKPEDDGCEGE